MAKFYGTVGFVRTEEKDPVDHPGVYSNVTTERSYYGDVLSNNRRFEKSDGLNDDLNIRNEISILADPFAFENFSYMKYVVWLGAKWKITDVKVTYPRMTLSIGGVFNDPEE